MSSPLEPRGRVRPPQPTPYPGDLLPDAPEGTGPTRRTYRDVLGRAMRRGYATVTGPAGGPVHVPFDGGVLELTLRPGEYRLAVVLYDQDGARSTQTETLTIT